MVLHPKEGKRCNVLLEKMRSKRPAFRPASRISYEFTIDVKKLEVGIRKLDQQLALIYHSHLEQAF
jgi:hypothetical protein